MTSPESCMENFVRKYLSNLNLESRISRISPWVSPLKDIISIVGLSLILSLCSEYLDFFRWFLDIFLAKNRDILDVYSISIMLLFTVFVAIFIETYRVFFKMASFGSRLLLEEYLEWRRVAILVPAFSLSLLFHALGDYEEFPGIVFLHWFGFIVWIALFWKVAIFNVKSVELIIAGEQEFYCILLKSLEKDSSLEYKEGVEMSKYDKGISQKWRTAWGRWSDLETEQREKFLSLFWKKQKAFFGAGNHMLVSRLFGDFSTGFLFLGDDVKNNQEKYNQWLNEKRQFLWFHEAKFDDGRENPYGIFERLLHFHWDAWREMDRRKKEERDTPERWGYWNSIKLSRKIEGILEHILRDEFENSDDFYYGLFRILKKHVKMVEENLKNKGVFNQYLKSIPIYFPCFDNANKYGLQEYTSGDVNSTGFPNEWRIKGEDVQNLSVAQVAWLNKFFEWSNSRIGHEEKPYDEKLDGSLKMLFPDARQSWMALSIAYRSLSLGNNRLESLCRWKQNFGMWEIGIGWDDYNPNQSDEEREKKRESYEKERRKNTVNIIRRLNLMPELITNPEASKEILDRLEFSSGSLEDLNRRDILELLSCIIENKSTIDV